MLYDIIDSTKEAVSVPTSWVCHECGESASGEFCGSCGAKKLSKREAMLKGIKNEAPVTPGVWRCESCSKTNMNGVSRCSCGQEKPRNKIS